MWKRINSSTSSRGRNRPSLGRLPFRSSSQPHLYVTRLKETALVFDPRNNRFLKLNASAIEMWTQLSSGKSVEDAAQSFSAQHGRDIEGVRRDLQEFVQRISALGLSTQCTLVYEGSAPGERAASQPPQAFPWYAKETTDTDTEPGALTIFAALCCLALFDAALTLCSFNAVCSAISRWPVWTRRIPDRFRLIGDICAAVNSACIWYPRKALCLQRSAVTTWLLRNRGIEARLVIGARSMPFAAHAWVEAEGIVVNDFPTVRRFYRMLASF